MGIYLNIVIRKAVVYNVPEEHQNSTDNMCQATKKCINCGGTHPATDRNCPIYIRQAAITRIMAQDNLPYFDARAMVLRIEKDSAAANVPAQSPFPEKNLKNFPWLPQKKGIALVNSPVSSFASHEHLNSNFYKDADPKVRARAIALLEKICSVKDIDALLERLEFALKLHTKSIDITQV